MEHRPALKFSLLLSTGIVAGTVMPLPAAPLFWTAVVLFAVALAAAVLFRDNGGWARLAHPGYSILSGLPGLPILIVVSGAALVTIDLGTLPRDDPAAFISADTVSVSGAIISGSSGNSGAGSAGRSARSNRLIVECDSISRAGVWRPLSGRILVVLTARAAAGLPDSARRLGTGDQVTVRGPILEVEPPRNPGELDWRAHYRLSGIRARMLASHPWQVTASGARGGGFVNRFVVPVREELGRRLGRFIGDREARFLNGLVLGERDDVPSDLRADFITVGVMHLLAISGQQVVLVAMLIAGLLAVFRIPEKPRFLIVAASLAYYVLLTGASPSVTRAGIMSVVMLGARVAQRRADILNALGVAASAILLYDPKQLFDPGFLLSFSAVLAIVLLYPLVLRATPGLTARCERVRLLDIAWNGAAISLAAGLGTAPIVAYFFGRVSVVGFLANILIVPLSSAALILGLLTLGASFAWDWLASVYGAGADLSAWLTFKLVGFFAGFPHASVDFRISLAVLGSFYALLSLAFVSSARRSWKPLLFGLLVAANLAVYGELLARPASGLLRVTFLDVRQGDAALVEFPGGETMLIDAGPRTFSFDAGDRTVVPYLRNHDVGRIDYLVVTHPHGDHLGGVPAVMSAFSVGSVVEGGSEGRSGLYERFLRLSDSLGVPRIRVRAGDTIGRDSSARVYVLAPDGREDAGPENLNDRSVVLLVRYGKTTVIFTGDAEEPSEEAMVERYGTFLDADILKAGHHGSRTSSSGAFVGDVTPAWTVVSSGEGNTFGHPSPMVLERLTRLGSAIHRTDRSGAAIFESDGNTWRSVEWRR